MKNITEMYHLTWEGYSLIVAPHRSDLFTKSVSIAHFALIITPTFPPQPSVKTFLGYLLVFMNKLKLRVKSGDKHSDMHSDL